jgi:hypothetical protein
MSESPRKDNLKIPKEKHHHHGTEAERHKSPRGSHERPRERTNSDTPTSSSLGRAHSVNTSKKRKGGSVRLPNEKREELTSNLRSLEGKYAKSERVDSSRYI